MASTINFDELDEDVVAAAEVLCLLSANWKKRRLDVDNVSGINSARTSIDSLNRQPMYMMSSSIDRYRDDDERSDDRTMSTTIDDDASSCIEQLSCGVAVSYIIYIFKLNVFYL